MTEIVTLQIAPPHISFGWFSDWKWHNTELCFAWCLCLSCSWVWRQSKVVRSCPFTETRPDVGKGCQHHGPHLHFYQIRLKILIQVGKFFLLAWTIQKTVLCRKISPASKASREVANLTERKNQHTHIYRRFSCRCRVDLS